MSKGYFKNCVVRIYVEGRSTCTIMYMKVMTRRFCPSTLSFHTSSVPTCCVGNIVGKQEFISGFCSRGINCLMANFKDGAIQIQGGRKGESIPRGRKHPLPPTLKYILTAEFCCQFLCFYDLKPSIIGHELMLVHVYL